MNLGLAQGEDVNVVIKYDDVNRCRFTDGGTDIEADKVDGGRRRHWAPVAGRLEPDFVRRCQTAVVVK